MESLLGCHFANSYLQLSMMSFEKEIGKRITIIRRSKYPKMSIEKLAELSGLSRQTISAIENGRLKKVAFSTIAKIARVLMVSLDDIGWKEALLEQVAEEQTEYKVMDAKKNERIGGESASERVPRHRHKKRA